MASHDEFPNPGPIPLEALFPSRQTYPDEARRRLEQKRAARSDLRVIELITPGTHTPHTWGFTIYRAVFGPDSDERFSNGMKRFEAWLRWRVRMDRYLNDGTPLLWDNFPQWMPREGDRDVTDDIAERLWNEVVQDYPGQETICSANGEDDKEGTEDFTAVGKAFVEYVASLQVDTTRVNTRYDHCLIIDETALQSIERLPEEVYPVIPPAENPEQLEAIRDTLYQTTWVWVLDRKTMQDKLDGKKTHYPIWIRLRLALVYLIWFGRPQEHVPWEWGEHVVEEDRHKWDSVFWWNPTAKTINMVMKSYRERAVDDADEERIV